jgi:capsular exopolysaccharide synthesis family protein
MPASTAAPTTESRQEASRTAAAGIPEVPPRVAVEASREDAAVVVASMAVPMGDDAPPVETARIVAESVAPTATAVGPREGERGGVYGAPHARENGGSRFDLEPMPAPSADDESGQLDDHLVSLLEPTSFAAEQYRAVRLAIETLRHERGTRVVAVSSPGRGEGKTITAVNLAGALAQSPDARVVLLEVDLRHPAVARYLGLGARRGLSSYLLDPAMPDEAILVHPAGVAFAVVPAGVASSMPYELLKSPRMVGLLATLRARFDYVVVDTPPVLPFPDVGILRDAVDGFVVVVRANRTPRELLHDAIDLIGRQRTLGLIFNDDDRSPGAGQSGDEGHGWRRYVAWGARAA